MGLDVCCQFIHCSFDDCMDICTSSCYHRQIGDMNHRPFLRLGHETMVCTVCLAMFFWRQVTIWSNIIFTQGSSLTAKCSKLRKMGADIRTLRGDERLWSLMEDGQSDSQHDTKQLVIIESFANFLSSLNLSVGVTSFSHPSINNCVLGKLQFTGILKYFRDISKRKSLKWHINKAILVAK